MQHPTPGHGGSGLRRLLAPLLCTAVGLSGCLWERTSPDLTDKDVRLTILHTSDIHSRLVPYDLAPSKSDRDLGLLPEAAPFGGAARMAALIKRERAKSERVIHLDSGDCFQGAPIFNQNTGEAEIRFMNLLQPDGVVIGNHEFDAGAMNFARQAEAWAKYPLFAANYDFTRPTIEDPTDGIFARISKPYEIINADGLRIGVIGMANLGSLNSIVEGGNSLGVTPLEQNETVRGYVQLLQDQVDLMVVVTHLGLTEDQDLVNGYEAVFERSRIENFLTRGNDPWTIVQDFGDGRVEVHIPGVRGLDVIMGGHLHVVLNPPQVLRDVDGREVVLQHSGAFAKYVGRLDLVIRNGEVRAHTYHAFPIDSLWCIPQELRDNAPPFESNAYYTKLMKDYKQTCIDQEDWQTHRLLDPYELGMANKLDLPMVFAYAPRNVERRNSSGGGDSPLGNLTADAMRRRQRVDAELAVTNTLGIRDNLYAGPITLESMFNVFPFENTITVMYLSGVEMQELFDFMTERSAGRGCQSQGQIAGASFIMDCGRALENERIFNDPEEKPCSEAAECVARMKGRGQTDAEASEWVCRQNSCYRHPSHDIVINGEALNPAASYKIAVNDYIGKGGSGFKVLKRNTTKIDTGISLRDALIDNLRKQCSCIDLEKTDEATVTRCAKMFGGIVAQEGPGDTSLPEQCRKVRLPNSCQTAQDFCKTARAYEAKLAEIQQKAEPTAADWTALGQAGAISAGRCGCHQVLAHDEVACGHITDALESFCEHPRSVPVVATEEDGRIARRVK